MEPRIRFCTSADGTRIAYATVGENPGLVVTPGSWESSSFVLEEDVGGRFFRALANLRGVARFDRRGTGLSDRNRTDFTLEVEAQDIAAVVDSLNVETVALMGSFHLGPAAITYACLNPQRVSHLILYGTYACGRDLATEEVKKSLVSMVRSHWGIASRTLADFTAPDVAGEMLERLARDEREAATGELVARLIEAAYDTDASKYLSGIRAPTLVLHRRGDRAVPFRKGRELASGIANARLGALDGMIHWPWFGDSSAVLEAIAEFLGVDKSTVAAPATAGPVTILFTDIEGSTALTERLGDERARQVLREHERLVREALASHGGSEIKTLGDGFMASFGSATKALECAVAIQKAFDVQNANVGARHTSDTGDEPLSEDLSHSNDVRKSGRASPLRPASEPRPDHPLRVRIGLNAGEPVAEGGDLFGTAVNLAARIAGQAQGGEILVSDVVRQLVAGKGFSFADRGEQALKGFDDPVRLYEVRWRDNP